MTPVSDNLRFHTLLSLASINFVISEARNGGYVMNFPVSPFVDEAFMNDCHIAASDPSMIFVWMFNKHVSILVYLHDDDDDVR